MSETSATTSGRDAETGFDPGTMKWLSGIVSLIGLWIAASPFVYAVPETMLWNNVIVGLAIFLVAGYNFYRMTKGMLASVGSAALVAILGMWTIVAPFLIAPGQEALLWSNVVAGIVVALIAAYNAYSSRQSETAPTAGTRA